MPSVVGPRGTIVAPELKKSECCRCDSYKRPKPREEGAGEAEEREETEDAEEAVVGVAVPVFIEGLFVSTAVLVPVVVFVLLIFIELLALTALSLDTPGTIVRLRFEYNPRLATRAGIEGRATSAGVNAGAKVVEGVGDAAVFLATKGTDCDLKGSECGFATEGEAAATEVVVVDVVENVFIPVPSLDE